MAYLLSILFGLSTSFAFKPFSVWPFAIFGLAGLFWLLNKSYLYQRLLISYLFGLSFLLTVQHWTSTYVGSIPWLILGFIEATFFLFPALLIKRKHRYNQIIFALSIILVELALRTIPFTGFGWSRLGFTQIDSPIASLYPLGGVVLVTFYIALLGASRTTISFVFLALIPPLASLIPSTVSFGQPVKVALVQGGVVNLGLDFNSVAKELFTRHVDQSIRSIAPGVADLVIWPENSVDVDIGANSDVSKKIMNLSSQIKTPLLVSGVQKNTYGRQNQAILFDPQIKQIYTKRYLTPFGEYIPLRSIAEKVSKYTSQVNDISAGKVNTIFKIQDTKFQSLICYELIDDRLIRQVESDFLVIQTNNATFGDTPQLDQQLNIARVRAAEISRYLPYVSTTGVTSFIGPQGEIISQVQKFEPATLFGEVAKATGVTYAQKYGRYLEFIAIFGSIGLLLMRRKGSR